MNAIVIIASALLGASTPNEKLAAPANATVGDIAALQATQLLTRMSILDEPFFLYYERQAKKLVLEVLGGREGTDAAKDILDNHVRKYVVPSAIAVIGKLSAIKIAEHDFVLEYTNRRTGKTLLRYEDAKYTIP